jgi:Mrp family chromosome partitioning ATPase
MHDVTTAHQISQCIENFDQLGKQFDGIIYNNYKKPKGYFGYYQYYGNYNYQYYAEKYLYTSYEYENE